jgi:hypothetical protein
MIAQGSQALLVHAYHLASQRHCLHMVVMDSLKMDTTCYFPTPTVFSANAHG